MTHLPQEIFKAYDIRGIVGKTLTPEIVEAIGCAIGSEGTARGVTDIVVGRDGRLSGPALIAALSDGIRAAGVNVIDIGCVATPLVYYAAHVLTASNGKPCGSGVMVTGSHNPPDYNGLKMMLAGETLYGDTILSLRQRIIDHQFADGAAVGAVIGAAVGAVIGAAVGAGGGTSGGNTRSSTGTLRTHDMRAAYFERVLSDIKLARPMKIAIDCGNGVPGAFAPELFRRLGCEVTELFCEVDGNFPNHHPDPAVPKNLQDLIACVASGDAELGFAFDGDGDRLGVVTKQGHIIYPDRQLMLYAQDVLSRNPGATILYDVKCTRNLGPWIEQHGGKPLLWKTGHSLVKAKMKETGAALGGEMSGHTFFKERWYGFDDAMYCGARLLEIVSRSANPSAVLDALPDSVTTPELQLKLEEGEHFALIKQLQRDARFPEAQQVIDIDGLRVEYADGFGLARASNTTPVVVLRFEGETEAALLRIQADFRRVLLAAKPEAALPF